MASAGNPPGLVTTPRDIARMGRLVLHGGVSDAGVRVISKAQLDALFMPTNPTPLAAGSGGSMAGLKPS